MIPLMNLQTFFSNPETPYLLFFDRLIDGHSDDCRNFVKIFSEQIPLINNRINNDPEAEKHDSVKIYLSKYQQYLSQ